MSVLDNIRVIDLTQALAGPYCTMMLGDMGAEIIKVEQPGSGDQSRGWGPPFLKGESTYFLAINRNKKSLTLDLKPEEGKAIMHKLVSKADVFVTNLPRQSSRQKTGVDSSTLMKLNPRLVYVSITGYGMTGPDAERPGYDVISQGESGLMSLTGAPEAGPVRYPIPLADMTAGVYAALGVMGALLAREKNGRGQVLDISLLESQSAWLAILASGYLNADKKPQRLGNLHPNIAPYEVFRTEDKPIIVAVGTQRLWALFCELLDMTDNVMNDPCFATNADRMANRDALRAIIEEKLKERKAGYWLDAFRKAQIPCGPINSVPDTLAHPQLLERGFLVELEHQTTGRVKSLANPVRFSDTVNQYRLPPPSLGEHNLEILAALGFSPADIEVLKKKNII
ncbi:MAG: CoA transferase [Candidatus Aminicenantes bacterium]|nr:CoA transferase [Candidatus Aminicenantes bacterium]